MPPRKSTLVIKGRALIITRRKYHYLQQQALWHHPNRLTIVCGSIITGDGFETWVNDYCKPVERSMERLFGK